MSCAHAHEGSARVLGGRVFADAEPDQALPFVVSAAIQNAGQTCSAGSRLPVEDQIYDAFVGEVADRFHTLDVGPAQRDLDCAGVLGAICPASSRSRSRCAGAGRPDACCWRWKISGPVDYIDTAAALGYFDFNLRIVSVLDGQIISSL